MITRVNTYNYSGLMQYNDKLQITTSNAINSVISSYQHNVIAGLRCLMNTAVILHKTHAPMWQLTELTSRQQQLALSWFVRWTASAWRFYRTTPCYSDIHCESKTRHYTPIRNTLSKNYRYDYMSTSLCYIHRQLNNLRMKTSPHISLFART